MSDTPIPGPDPGACPNCGVWRKAGLLHSCVTDEIPQEWVEAASRVFEPDTWDDSSWPQPDVRDAYRADALELARSVLAAVLPLIQAESKRVQTLGIASADAPQEDRPEDDDAVHIAALDDARRTLCGQHRRMNVIALDDERPDGMAGCWTCLNAAGEIDDLLAAGRSAERARLAERIERLETALRNVCDPEPNHQWREYLDAARAALSEGSNDAKSS